MSQVSGLDRRACRDDVTSRFSADRLVADHLQLYEQIGRGPSESS
jgi:hypothetical protein